MEKLDIDITSINLEKAQNTEQISLVGKIGGKRVIFFQGNLDLTKKALELTFRFQLVHFYGWLPAITKIKILKTVFPVFEQKLKRKGIIEINSRPAQEWQII